MKYLVMYVLLLSSTVMQAEQAIVVVPVADLIGQPISGYFSYDSVLKGYQQIPLCGGNTAPYDSCPRMHQILFNERVDIIRYHKDEVLVEIKSAFFINKKNKTPQLRYWTLKKNILPFSTLKKHNVTIAQFPPPLHFQQPNSFAHNNVVTLKRPFFDQETKQTYSAGTRFVQVNSNQVFIYDAQHNTMKKTTIPWHYLAKRTINHTAQIKQFVRTLKEWAHQTQGYIPYVWGGTSFIHTQRTTHIIEKDYRKNKQKRSYFTRKDDTHVLKTGMDCAGLIIRAAQVNGIPFCFKNSTTIAKQLAPLKKNEKLHPGDIIWVRGHVMIVADLKKNTLIEARAYNHNYGKIHEVSLSKVFHGIHSYQDLQKVYFTKKPLKRIDKSGKIRDTFSQVKLLKLASVWQAD